VQCLQRKQHLGGIESRNLQRTPNDRPLSKADRVARSSVLYV
jgi:hypothetical protein